MAENPFSSPGVVIQGRDVTFRSRWKLTNSPCGMLTSASFYRVTSEFAQKLIRKTFYPSQKNVSLLPLDYSSCFRRTNSKTGFTNPSCRTRHGSGGAQQIKTTPGYKGTSPRRANVASRMPVMVEDVGESRP